jgi:cysteinyl-tRNA synthetase
MSMKRVSLPIDIHAGGVDLIFPHHENEIAQSEAATGKKFANWWIHGEHLLASGKKMSKSLGNFYALKDLEEKGFSPLAFRYLALTAHYRSKINFTWKSLEAAREALDKLIRETQSPSGDKKGNKKSADKYEKVFSEYINDDLNAPKALSLAWKVLKDKSLSPAEKKKLVFDFDKILGLGLEAAKPAQIPEKILKLAEKRGQLRANKQFIKADALRKQIEGLGYKIEDDEHKSKITPSGH